jgi:UDP-N-acetylmuramate--alanine ligase
MSGRLADYQSVHIVGVGGAGMSAIATVLVAMGHQVSGSDVRDSATLERLRALGVAVHVGHDANHVASADLVAISSAIGDANVELRAARASDIPVWSRAETLVAITAERRLIAVAGTHGKTTTSSMLALILVEAGLQPSFLIGGDLNEIGTNASWGDGAFLVAEADESDGTFLELAPEIAVVTSVEADHLDHFGSLGAIEDAFRDFLAPLGDAAIVCADDPGALRCAPDGATTYGFARDASLRIADFTSARAEISFSLRAGSEDLGRFAIPVPGAHNARNATGAIAAALRAGAGVDDARRALARFGGVARRFQFRGEVAGVSLVDDYAHLPGEVTAVLAAARSGGWKRIVCVFQPHRFSRTASLAPAFAEAFEDADVVVITDIYPAGETPLPGVSGRLVSNAVFGAHPEADVTYVADRTTLAAYLGGVLRAGDCCLSLGAGDLTSLPDELLEQLR